MQKVGTSSVSAQILAQSARKQESDATAHSERKLNRSKVNSDSLHWLRAYSQSQQKGVLGLLAENALRAINEGELLSHRQVDPDSNTVHFGARLNFMGNSDVAIVAEFSCDRNSELYLKKVELREDKGGNVWTLSEDQSMPANQPSLQKEKESTSLSDDTSINQRNVIQNKRKSESDRQQESVSGRAVKQQKTIESGLLQKKEKNHIRSLLQDLPAFESRRLEQNIVDKLEKFEDPRDRQVLRLALSTELAGSKADQKSEVVKHWTEYAQPVQIEERWDDRSEEQKVRDNFISGLFKDENFNSLFYQLKHAFDSTSKPPMRYFFASTTIYGRKNSGLLFSKILKDYRQDKTEVLKDILAAVQSAQPGTDEVRARILREWKPKQRQDESH